MPKRSSSATGESALFGFARLIKSGDRSTEIQIRWGRVLGLLAFLGLSAWFTGAGALYFFFKYRHAYEEVSFSKMLVLPFRMDAHRLELGNYHVRRGLEFLEEQEYRSALHLLRVGVARSRANFEGRVVLAQIYDQGLRRPDLAIAILRDGLAQAATEPRFMEMDYLRTLFRLMLDNQMDEELVELSGTLRPKIPPEDPRTFFLALAAAQAKIFRGHFAEAESLLDEYGLSQTPDGFLLTAQIRWNRGQRNLAIAMLIRGLERYPAHDGLYGTLMRYYRENEDWSVIRRYSILRSSRFPEKPGPRVDLLFAYAKTGDTHLITEAVEELLRDFEHVEVLPLLARFAGEAGLPDLAERFLELSDGLEIERAPMQLLVVESYLRATRFQEALDRADAFAEENPAWGENVAAIEQALRGVALYGLGRTTDARIVLREFLKDTRVRPSSHIAVANHFSGVGAFDIAREILQRSLAANPESQPVLTSLVMLDIETLSTASFLNNLKQLLRMRVPDKNVLEASYRALGSDRHMFLVDRDLLLLRLEELLYAS